MDRQDIENRRADNQVWNGAGDYGLRADFQAFGPEGEADLYFNTVIGLLYRYCDYGKLKPLFNTFQSQTSGAFYGDLFWLGLEGYVFRRAEKDRPVLAQLRRDYAQRVTAQPRKGAEREGIQNLRWLWFRRALGERAQEDAWERGVLDDLTFPASCTEQELCARMEALLHKWFHRARRSVTDRQWAAFAGRDILQKGKKQGGLVRSTALRRLGQPGGGPAEEEGRKFFWQRRLLLRLGSGKTREEVLRSYVENCFGTSMLTPPETAAAEKLLCTGAHQNCRLHFTRGVLPARAVEPGTAGNAAAGTILTMSVAPAGIAACTNPAPFSGGEDDESDEHLRVRVLETYRRLANGANAAFYEQQAMAFEEVAAAVVLPRNRGRGTVDVVIATQAGVPGAELVERVQERLDSIREIAVDVLVSAPVTQTVDVTLQIQAAENRDGAAVREQVRQAVLDWFNGQRLGKPVLRAQLGGLIYAVDGVENYTIEAPAADVELDGNELPVLGELTVEAMDA